MVELKLQKPYIDENGNVRNDLEKHYAEDEKGNSYYIKQVETNIEYQEAVDITPCKYSYIVTNHKVHVESEGEENGCS